MIVWKKSMDLTVKIYKLTQNFPKAESYGLVNQIKRAVVAIPSNIAEGHTRIHTKEYLQFVNIAFASGAELETQLELSNMLGYIPVSEYYSIITALNEVMCMLNKLSQALKTKIVKP